MPAGPRRALRRVGVRRVVADVRDVVLVDLDPERVAEAHRVDLGPGLGLRRARDERVQVAGRDRVRAGAGAEVGLVGVGGGDVAVLDLDAQHLAAQVVGVERAAAGVAGQALVPAALPGAVVGARRVPPVRPAPSAVICGLVGLLQRAAEEHVDVRRAAPGRRWSGSRRRRCSESASSAASTCAAVALHGDRRGRLAVEGQRERAGRRVGDAHGLLLVGLLVVERAVAAGVDAARGRVVARDQPQVAVLVEVDVTRDVAALLPVHRDPEDLLLGASSPAAGRCASSTNLKRESWW